MLSLQLCFYALSVLLRPVLRGVRRLRAPPATPLEQQGATAPNEPPRVEHRLREEALQGRRSNQLRSLQTTALASILTEITLRWKMASEAYSASARRRLRRHHLQLLKSQVIWTVVGTTFEQVLLIWTWQARHLDIQEVMYKRNPKNGAFIKRRVPIDEQAVEVANAIRQQCPELAEAFEDLLHQVRAERRARDTVDEIEYSHEPFFVNTVHGRPENMNQCPLTGAQFFDRKWMGINPLTGENRGFAYQRWERRCARDGCGDPIPLWLGCSRCAHFCTPSADDLTLWECLQECENEEHWRQLVSVTDCAYHRGYTAVWVTVSS